jgi:glycosyltransferase involved in cell wall biosynthesis
MHCEWLSQLPGEYVSKYLQSGDWIATCSDHVREALVLALPEWANRSSTLPNGVDTSTIAIGNNLHALRKSKTILFVGRISPEKGIHVLIEAFKKIAKDFKEARLLIVGPEAPTPEEFLVDISADPTVQGLRCFYRGESYARILRKQVPNWLVERVNFLGAVGHTELPALYQEAAMLVNPSLSESFGMSVIEAMACGCPVVVAQTGGMKSIVNDGVNGIVAPADDARALAASISRIFKDPDLARGFANRGRTQTVELYDWAKVAMQTLQLHRRLVEESG